MIASFNPCLRRIAIGKVNFTGKNSERVPRGLLWSTLTATIPCQTVNLGRVSIVRVTRNFTDLGFEITEEILRLAGKENKVLFGAGTGNRSSSLG